MLLRKWGQERNALAEVWGSVLKASSDIFFKIFCFNNSLQRMPKFNEN